MTVWDWVIIGCFVVIPFWWGAVLWILCKTIDED